MKLEQFTQLDEYRWQIPMTEAMRVPGQIYASRKMMEQILRDNAADQVANVATLPGIVRASMAMPDIHWGYGFPIGGVAAMRLDGVVSPGGVGYDINCGVRLLSSKIPAAEIALPIERLLDAIFQAVPCGVGKAGSLKLSHNQLDDVLRHGSAWAVKQGYGVQSDIDCTEERGEMTQANPDYVSDRAKKRGSDQLGTLGSGNHFLEIQEIVEIYDEDTAATWGLVKGNAAIMIHCGSRGLGHQVCDEYAKGLVSSMGKYGIEVPDRQLASAPISSPDGERYIGAMAAAANFAWANRQIIMHNVRGAMESVLGEKWQTMGLNLVYDVAHNMAKFETHTVDGRETKLLVHRKGATRAFGPGRRELPDKYRATGQPVIIPGDMGRYSFVLAGTEHAMNSTFGSSCHGAGRMMSRNAAIRNSKGRHIAQELRDAGIAIRWVGRDTLQEENSDAYKDVADVVDVIHNAGISRRIAKLRPLGVIKG